MTTAALQVCNDENLVIAYRATGASPFLGELYRRYYQRLFAYCLKITGDPEEAYDIVSECFIKVAEKMHTLKNPLLFASWLFRIAHNDCMDHSKCKKRRRNVAVDWCLEVAYEEFDESEAREKDHRYEALDTLLNQVSPDARAMLMYKYCEGRSIADLQQQFQLSESAVKMRLSRAKNRIAKLYAVAD